MEKNKRVGLYEGMYIFRSSLSEEGRKTAFEKITSAIEAKDGKVLKIHDMGQRKLMYKIDKVTQGYYFVIFFEAPTLAILELNAESKFNEDLIRSMTLRVEKVQETLEFKPLKEAV